MLLIFALACLPAASRSYADGDGPTVLFDPFSYSDGGDFVQVEGTLVGDDIPYKNNRVSLYCFRFDNQCVETDIDVVYGNHILSLGIPEFFSVKLWSTDTIVADFSVPCGGFDTWTLHRKAKVAERSDRACNSSTVSHSTLE